jgi:hypothetical protein
MSLGITIFGPSHYWWTSFKDIQRVWFHKSDEVSTGGVGFCIPGLHVVFTWGRRA